MMDSYNDSKTFRYVLAHPKPKGEGGTRKRKGHFFVSLYL